MAELAAKPRSQVRQGLYRLFEAAPGVITWVMLLSPAWIPLVFGVNGAIVVAYGVLGFDCYWFVRSFLVIGGILTTYRRMKRNMGIDWWQRCREVEAAGADPNPLDYYHLCIIPTYTEPYHVLEATCQAIVDANYPEERKIVGIITRETDKPGWENVARLEEKFGDRLAGFYHIKHPLVAFSSYTCTLEFVHEVGYWDKDVIPEDSRFYWKAFFRFGERFQMKSVWLPIYGDSPIGRDYAASHASQYNQIKRWAWGITDVPYVLQRLPKHPEIPLRLRLVRFLNLFLNHLNWIFLPVFLLFGASIPIWVSTEFSITDLGEQLWIYSSLILSATTLTVVGLIWLEYKMLPPPPAEWNPVRRFLVFLQYFSYPVVGLVLSVLPALEAHTRLLLGKYLEYRVTEKG